ncbi:MAG: adenylate/guanylate cyclase domain-containing protein, partial [Microcystaceae cyanobacterium]
IFTGQLTELSQNCAKIVMDSSSQNMKLSPYTNLKLNLHQSVNSKSFISNDIYGKISDRPVEKGSFYLDFTSQDPILDEILAKASSL